MEQSSEEHEEDGLIPIEPLDEQEEARRREIIRRILDEQRDMIAEMTGEIPIPLEHRESLRSEDIEHFVVNYCLDLFGGHRQRAALRADQLRQFGELGRSAVENFLSGRSKEPALRPIPTKLLESRLKQLLKDLQRQNS